MARSTSPTCARVFEAEAARDGRLTGAARAHFEAHAAGCASCAQEARGLEELARALRKSGTAGETDELHVRRERTRLLAAFDASLIPRPREGHAKRWLAFGLAAAMLSGLLWLRARAEVPAPSKGGPADVIVPAASLAKVEAEAGARWTRRIDDGFERIVLESGTLAVRVTHASPSRRLLVVLPDGELEDIGTVFTVTADAGHTTAVRVQEGRVVLRLRDQPPRQLVAGENWTPAPAPEKSAAPPLVPRAAPVAPRRADAAADFRVALSALNAAESARAAALFTAFLSEHPGDSRTEDAAYLRVIALQRAGKLAEMRSAAGAYLSRYPRGFRRAEVEPLAGAAQ